MGVSEVIDLLGRFLEWSWWWIAFAIITPLAAQMWRAWRMEVYEHAFKEKSILLEINVPREVAKSPRAMEQVLAAIHELINTPGDLQEWWWDGEITIQFVLEMVSLGGEVHFYIRTYRKYRRLVESAFFSFYSDVEIVEVEDYIDKRIPKSVRELYAQGYDLWGSEMVLGRSDAYPIKNYEDFESPDEEKQYDPISAFVEIMAKIHPEEFVGIQFILMPIGDHWAHHFEHVVEELRMREKKHAPKGVLTAVNFKDGPMPHVGGEHHEEEESGNFFKSFMRTPGETDVLKAVEQNLSRPAFETLIRFMYLSPEPTFFDSYARRGMRSAFNQYAALDQNYFTRNDGVSTRVKIFDFPYVFPKIRAQYRKSRLLFNYRHRELVKENFMARLVTSFFFNPNFASKPVHLTTRSLATLFHPPTRMVLTAPHIHRVESKKGGPPSGLAIFGEEENVEQYQ